VQATLGVYPPAPGDSLTPRELARRAAQKIDAYFNALPNDWQRFARVPPTLADRLKRETRWGIYRRGIECSVRRARELAIPR
jgi:hypothetical protein